MPTVADVLRRYGGEYLEQFGATMPAEHKKVLRAITACRTGALVMMNATTVGWSGTYRIRWFRRYRASMKTSIPLLAYSYRPLVTR